MKNDNLYLHPELETLSRSRLEKLQMERLQQTLARCMRIPFYKQRFAACGLRPEDIRTLDDVRKLPFTTKQDLRDNYPFGLSAVPLEEVVRLHSSSGTTGTPTVILHTQHDLDEWANAVARCLYMVGLRKGDIFQNSSGYGMFTGGLGFQYGAERLGMLTVPAAAGNTKRQIKFITDFGTTALHAIPSYAGRLYEVMEEMGIDPRRDTRLRTLIIGAEPHSDEQRRRIEQMLGVKAYNSFGMSEMCGPGVAFECPEQNGLHIWEDYYIVEIGRSDDMMILKGVNIFPIQIENILMQFRELGTDYLITLTNLEANDEMTVEVELNEFTDDYGFLQRLTKEITRQLKDEILITPRVKLVPKGSLPKQEGKAVRVKDLRKTLI